MSNTKPNLAELARKTIFQLSDIGNELVDNFVEPLSTSEITIKDFLKHKFDNKILQKETNGIKEVFVTLCVPGANSETLDISKNNCSEIDIYGASQDSQNTDWKQFTYHYIIKTKSGFNEDSLKVQLRDGLLKINFTLKEFKSNKVNIDT